MKEMVVLIMLRAFKDVDEDLSFLLAYRVVCWFHLKKNFLTKHHQLHVTNS